MGGNVLTDRTWRGGCKALLRHLRSHRQFRERRKCTVSVVVVGHEMLLFHGLEIQRLHGKPRFWPGIARGNSDMWLLNP